MRRACRAAVIAKPRLLNSDAVQSLVFRLQLRSRRQLHRREQMGVDIADPAPEQRISADEMVNLYVRGNARMGQVRERVQRYFIPVARRGKASVLIKPDAADSHDHT